jgi:hypothetical protein
MSCEGSHNGNYVRGLSHSNGCGSTLRASGSTPMGGQMPCGGFAL